MAMKKSGGKRRGVETERSRYWRRMIAAWETSGLTQAEFCRRRQVSASAFHWWRGELRKRSRRDEESGSPPSRRKTNNRKSNAAAFIPVVIKQEEDRRTEDSRIELMIPSGHLLRVPRDFHDETLIRLLKAVESAC